MSVRGAAGSGPGVPRPGSVGARKQSSAASLRNTRPGRQQSKVGKIVTEDPRGSGNFTITYGKSSVTANWDNTQGTITFKDPNINKRTIEINVKESTAKYTHGSGENTTTNPGSLPPIDDGGTPADGIIVTSLLSVVVATLASLTTLHASAPTQGAPSTKSQHGTPVRQSGQSTPMAHAGGSIGNASDETASKLQTFVEKLLEESAKSTIMGVGTAEGDLFTSLFTALFSSVSK
jgi:hypothetical protein